MKKIVLVCSILAIGLASYSQVNKGQWLIGGSGSLDFSKHGTDDSKITSVNISPNAGYFFINQFAGGARVSFTSVNEKAEENTMTTFLFAPFVRYYFLPSSQKVNVFADASYGFGSAKFGSSESFNQFAINAGPAIFLSPNTALELTLQYKSAGGDLYGDDRLNDFGVNVGFQVHLGK